MLLPPHPHLSYFTTNASVPTALGVQCGTSVTSGGSANTAGTWTQIHAGLTYPSEMVMVRINAIETSGDVIAATTLNCYFDIGIGPNSGAVTTIVEKLGGSQAQGLGVIYVMPLRIPPDTPVWARHQNTAASAKGAIQFTAHGGNANPGSLAVVTRIVALGATTASTTGTTVTPASATEDAWTQIVASTAEDYAGFMVSPLFNVDTSLTNGLISQTDLAVGGSGSEKVIAENITTEFLWSTAEQKDAFCWYTLVGVPTGSRLCTRTAGSTTADGTASQIIYAFVH